MKKIIFSIFSILIFSACNQLDLSPEDYYGSGNFWNNKAQVDGFMVGLHADLRGAYSSMYTLGEARGGTSKHGTSSLNVSINYSSPIKDNDFSKDKTGTSNWNGYFAKILQVNLFIQNVETGCKFLTEKDRGYLLGQGYGLRAYYYFMLYRTYGGVPIIKEAQVINGVTEAKDLYNPRATPAQTLSFIKEDINKSETNFGDDFTFKGTRSMWSKAATLVLKGEIYLWSAKVTTGDQSPAATDLQTAKAALSQLEGKFTLMPKFTDIFEYTKKGNDETIFAFRFLDGESTNFASEFTYSDNVFLGQVYGRNDLLISNDTLNLKSTGIQRNEYKFGLFESYDNLDTRKEATFLDFYLKDRDDNIIGKGLSLKKAIGIINSNGNRVYASDIPLYRYADVLLLLAEVENKLGGDPSGYINQVRARAYGAKYDEDIHGYTKKSFAENELAILHERDKEFVWEGKRWFDVLRMHDASGKALVFSAAANYDSSNPVLDFATEAYKVLWPIDANTLNNDPTLVQTPNYPK